MQLNAKYLVSYDARLGEVDHYRNGKRLKSVADIIAQNRYNYHVKHIWQGYEDTWDPYFDKQSNRDIIKKLIKAISPTLQELWQRKTIFRASINSFFIQYRI